MPTNIKITHDFDDYVLSSEDFERLKAQGRQFWQEEAETEEAITHVLNAQGMFFPAEWVEKLDYSKCPNGHGSMKAMTVNDEGDPAPFEAATKIDYECEACKYAHVIPR